MTRWRGRGWDLVAGLLLAALVAESVAVHLRRWPNALDRIVDRHWQLPWDPVGHAVDPYMNHSVAALALLAVGLGLWWWWRGERRWAVLVGGGVVLGFGAVESIKPLVGRRLPPSTQWSFPSGHEAAIVTMVFAVALHLAWHRREHGAARFWVLLWLLVAIPVAAGFALTGLRIHYPTDVIAGAELGLAIAVILARVLRLLPVSPASGDEQPLGLVGPARAAIVTAELDQQPDRAAGHAGVPPGR